MQISTQRFKDKIVLVTGGNSGMGFATAKRVVAEGGRVIITGRDIETLRGAQQELGENAEAIRADVANLADIDALFQSVKAKYGRLDALFANAGIAKFSAVEDVTEREFDQLFDVNVKGTYFTLQRAVPLLTRGSSVVLNASVAASAGTPTTSVYGATKAAVRSMARTFSAAYVERGIRFNAVSPGPIETPIWGRPGSIPSEAIDATKKAVAESTPVKRYGTADEAAAAITFLLSEDSSYLLGTELFVDGGMNQL